MQFHEDPKIISGWLRLAGPVLRWLTPSRRRPFWQWEPFGSRLETSSNTNGESPCLVRGAPRCHQLDPCDRHPVRLSVALLTGLALKFSSLPSFVRRNPQLCLHALFWLLLIVLWNTSPEAGIWRIVLVGLAIKLPFFLWRVGYMLISAKRGKVAGTRFRDHLMYFWPCLWRIEYPVRQGSGLSVPP